MKRSAPIVVVAVVLTGSVSGCGDDGTEVTAVRGVPGGLARPNVDAATEDKPATPAAAGAAPAPAAPGVAPAGEAPVEPSKRPKQVLTREDFANTTRDPFQSFVGNQMIELEPDRPRAQREVRMAEYNFEDLRLVAIVHSGRNIVPRALFVASDGKSKSIRQGEYFSRAEVLLASVNRDYVEVEVVDERLAANLNLARGERRAIYLRNE